MAGCAPGRAGGPRWGPRGDAPPLPLSESFFLGGGLAAEVAKDVNRTVNSRQFLGCQGAVAFMPSSHPQILRVPLPECTAQLPSFISLGCLAKFNWITRNI